jgi:putative tricarboxylic transport membrane protein
LKTVVMICLGLVLSTVGLDLISGQPRLIFSDSPGFHAGISFLVLASGACGIGEVLWTLEKSNSSPTVTAARVTFRELAKSMSKRRETLGKGNIGGVIAPRRRS